ncbi:DoxX family protein [Belliella sp. DSM 111904]|uniref:DoxX family protein n=1 Tax=Belliella filtrata TaxID=2923435 RepID=A0ABS9UUB9_9BACT|nr:DoxX family protein [Belliella filtrata]MCH7407772.1 DoxX family protein [Belliella filtrata]
MKRLIFFSNTILKDLALLILRAGAGLMMATHGWAKLSNFSSNLQNFADPIGLGPAVSLQLVIFAEFFCALFLAIGFLTRVSLVPLIIAMLVAAFVAHAGDPFGDKELSLMYLTVFVSLFLLGPGGYSLDAQIRRKSRY